MFHSLCSFGSISIGLTSFPVRFFSSSAAAFAAAFRWSSAALKTLWVRHKFVEIFFAFDVTFDRTGKQREMIDDRRENQRKSPTCNKQSGHPSRTSHFESLYRQFWRSIGASYRASTLSPFLQATHERIVWSTGCFIHNERRRERKKPRGWIPCVSGWKQRNEMLQTHEWICFHSGKKKSKEYVHCETSDVNRRENTNELAWFKLPLPRTHKSTWSFLIA